MRSQQHETDLDGRRLAIGPSVHCLPVTVTDQDGVHIGRFKSPRKLAKAIIGGAVVLMDGDRAVVGREGEKR
jgi:hypothetical protein